MSITRLVLIGLLSTAAGCTKQRTPPQDLINRAASPPADLGFRPLQWRVISSTIHPQDSSMATLFGNDVAVNFARANPQRPFPAQSVLSLVTWQQQDDPHWFGARIPGRIKSVELVTVNEGPDHRPAYAYERYEGAPLRKVTGVEADTLEARLHSILNQRASIMPDGTQPVRTL